MRRRLATAIVAAAVFPPFFHTISPQTTYAQPPSTDEKATSTVIGITSFVPVFQLSSQSGEQVETDAIKLPDRTLSVADIENTPLTLGIIDGRFAAPEGVKQKVKVRLKDLAYPAPAPYQTSAITSILKQVAARMNELGVIAVLPQADPAAMGEDKKLKLVVQLGVATDVRTIASGDRVPKGGRINAEKHEKVRFGSPVRPAESSKQVERKDVIRKDLLDEYVFALNRHPGRRVDVAVSQAEVPGGVVLDYLVSEAKPWTIYAQASNTGTEQTNEWRQRFGLVHNQLTGHDDILSIDYVTSSFDSSSQAVVGSYEFPIPGLQKLRGRVFGSWSSYVASDVGQTNENFSGDQTTGGAELIANVWQHGNWFGDLIAGARYEHVSTDNDTVDTSGEADLGMPYVGARVERVTETSSFAFSTTATFGFTDAGDEDLTALGRINADEDFVILDVGGNYSFYIEPVLFPSRFRGDRPEGAPQPKLAHELSFSARGQTALGARLIPQQQDVVGGLYTVRGYPESVVAGDDVVIGTAEYRFHLPRAFDMQPTPTQVFGRPFRVAPDRMLGRPDWDLVLKAFVDGARALSNDRFSFEQNETLVGTGIGLELQLKQNFNFQVYWGVALTDVEEQWDAGDNRFHFIFTAMY